MDWPLAISRNRDALRSIVAALFAMTGMVKGGMLTTLPRNLYLMTLAILRPAESAVRRLIVIAAQGLAPSRAVSRKPGGWPDLPTCGGDVGAADREGRAGRKAFQLFDPLKSFDPDDFWDVEPQFESGFGLTRSAYSSSEDTSNPRIDATLLGQRLDALRRALDTIPASSPPSRPLATAPRCSAESSKADAHRPRCAPACRPAGASEAARS